MTADLATLSVAAITIGFFHCVCGPDHYVPFVAMSRVGVWSLRKTLLVTLLCGIGHVVGTAMIGFVGIALGLIVFQLEAAETVRGSLAAWLFIAFGLAYSVWGITHAIGARHSSKSDTPARAANGQPEAAKREAIKPEAATESALLCLRSGGSLDQATGPAAAEALDVKSGQLTPWVLFTLFLFGPCEPLIPLLMYPAAKANVWSVVWVTSLFGFTTLVTMTALVALIYAGTTSLRFELAHRYGHALAGLIVLACGLAIQYGL